MYHAEISDFETVKEIFYLHKKWFPHIRTDYIKRMIAKKNLILENVRKSIEKSLLEFSGLSREEVFNKRKEKFLSIGRNKGFTSTSRSKTSLSLENNSFLNFVNKFKKKQLIFLGLVILSMLFLGIIFI